MNAVRPLPKSPNLKPPPLPKACGLSVVPSPAQLGDIRDDLEEVTAVAEAPPEILQVARSDVRELRASRPAPPRPTASRPPPLPAAPKPASTPVPATASTPVPAARPESPSELEMRVAIQPRSVVLVRTAWFFGVFVTTGAFRWTIGRLSAGRAWLAAEWRHAAIRAKAPR